MRRKIWSSKSIFDFDINTQVFDLLLLYLKEETEMGGIVFSQNKEIIAISCKRGQKFSISFLKDNPTLFIGPINSKIVGTWHSHLGNNTPSRTDLNQWKKWGHEYFHIIINTLSIKLYNWKGKLIKDIKIAGENDE